MKDVILNYLSSLGLPGLAGGVLIESMGLPFPGGIMVILTGFLINQGKLDFTLALLTTYVGYTVGSFAAYFIGRYGGKPFLARFGRLFHISEDKFEQTLTWLDRSAPAFIIFGRFLPGLSNLTPYLAGVSRIGAGYFLFYNSIFALGWGILYLLLGMFFGHNYELIAGYLNKSLPLAGLSILVIFFGYQYIKKYLAKREEKM